MVATINPVKVMLGDLEIPVEQITVEEWVQTIRQLIQKMYLGHLKGFATVETLYAYSGPYGIARVVDASESLKAITRLYVSLADIVPAPHEWKDFPTSEEPLDPSLPRMGTHMVPQSFWHQSLLLNRKGDIYEFCALWNPHEKCNELGFRESLTQWATTENCRMCKITDGMLASMMHHHPKIIGQIVHSLWVKQRETNTAIEALLRHDRTMETALERVNRVTWKIDAAVA